MIMKGAGKTVQSLHIYTENPSHSELSNLKFEHQDRSDFRHLFDYKVRYLIHR